MTARLLAILLLSASAAFAAAPEIDSFPAEKLLGRADDPLAALAAEAANEELRDAPAAPFDASALARGLRSPDMTARLSAIRAAGAPGAAWAIPPLSARLLKLDEQPAERAAAALSLARVGHPVAAPSLETALGDPAPEVRAAAALALGRLRPEGSITTLGRVLRADTSWWVRCAAAMALGRTRRPIAATPLREAVQGDKEWQVRLHALRALQELPGRAAAPAAIDALSDPDSGVRAAAGLALSQQGDETALAPLRAAAIKEPDASTHAVLTQALRRLLARP